MCVIKRVAICRGVGAYLPAPVGVGRALAVAVRVHFVVQRRVVVARAAVRVRSAVRYDRQHGSLVPNGFWISCTDM